MLREATWQFLKMLKIELMCDPAVSLLGKCLRELKEKIQSPTPTCRSITNNSQWEKQPNVCQEMNDTH